MPTRRSTASADRAAPSRAVGKQAAPVGPACALVLSMQSRPALALSYWDLWFALVADADFEGSWERFVEHLRGQKAKGGGPMFSWSAAEPSAGSPTAAAAGRGGTQ